MALQLTFPQVSFIQFIVTFGIMFLVIFGLALYLSIFVWTFGKPMRKYLKARLTPNRGIIQEFTHEVCDIHLAKVEDDEFTDLERKGYFSEEQLPSKWYHKILHINPGKTYKSVKPLTSKSTVQIAGVQTLLVWNATPPLPERYTTVLKALVKLGYNKIEDIENALVGLNGDIIDVEDKIKPTQTTYKEFLQMHSEISNKNTVHVTASDVLGFNDKFLDKHPIRSVIEKEITAESKRRQDNKFQKYAFILIGIEIIGGLILIAYKIHSGSGATP